MKIVHKVHKRKRKSAKTNNINIKLICFRSHRFQYTKKTGHKITLQEKHAIHHHLCHVIFRVKYKL